MKNLFLFLLVTLSLSKTTCAQSTVMINSTDVTWSKSNSNGGKTVNWKANVISSSIGNSLGIAAINADLKRKSDSLRDVYLLSKTNTTFDSVKFYGLLKIQRTDIQKNTADIQTLKNQMQAGVISDSAILKIINAQAADLNTLKTKQLTTATIVGIDSTLYKLLQIQRSEIDQLKARPVINADSLNKVIIAQAESIKSLKLRLDTQPKPVLDSAAFKSLLKKFLVKQKADTLDIPKVPYKVILTPYDAGL